MDEVLHSEVINITRSYGEGCEYHKRNEWTKQNKTRTSSDLYKVSGKTKNLDKKIYQSIYSRGEDIRESLAFDLSSLDFGESILDKSR